MEFGGVKAQNQTAATQSSGQFHWLAGIHARNDKRADAIGQRPVKGQTGIKGGINRNIAVGGQAGQFQLATQIAERQIDIGVPGVAIACRHQVHAGCGKLT